MADLLRLYLQIALLRRGPADVPASAVLLGLTVVGYFAVNYLVSALLPPLPGPWLAEILVDIAFLLAWYTLLLRLLRRPERFLQTATAVFGYQAVLSPLSIGALWFLRRFGDDPSWQLPASVIGLGLAVWSTAANSRVVKAALDWSMTTSVILVVVQMIIEQVLILSLFPNSG